MAAWRVHTEKSEYYEQVAWLELKSVYYEFIIMNIYYEYEYDDKVAWLRAKRAKSSLENSPHCRKLTSRREMVEEPQWLYQCTSS